MKNEKTVVEETAVVQEIRDRSVLNRNYGKYTKSPFKYSELTDEQKARYGVDDKDMFIGIEALMCSGGYVDEEGKRWIMNPFSGEYYSVPHTKEDEEKLVKELKDNEK